MSTPAQRSPLSFELDYPQPVGEFRTYDEAQAAVDYLSDQKFPVENLMIVGTNLKSQERVLGRRTWGSVLLQGAISGLGTGLFVGLMLYLFFAGTVSFPMVLIVGVLLGAFFGLLSAAFAYALTGGRRDFESMKKIVATSYELLCEHKVAEQARTVLAGRKVDPSTL